MVPTKLVLRWDVMPTPARGIQENTIAIACKRSFGRRLRRPVSSRPIWENTATGWIRGRHNTAECAITCKFRKKHAKHPRIDKCCCWSPNSPSTAINQSQATSFRLPFWKSFKHPFFGLVWFSPNISKYIVQVLKKIWESFKNHHHQRSRPPMKPKNLFVVDESPALRSGTAVTTLRLRDRMNQKKLSLILRNI